MLGRRQDEPRPRGRLRRPHRPGRSRASPTSASAQAVAHEGFFYAPDPSSQLACTIARQYRDEFRRRALPEIWRHDQQPARRHAGADRRHRRDTRRRASRQRRLRSARPGHRLGGPARHRHRGDGAHPARRRRRAPGAVRLRARRTMRAPASRRSSPPASSRWRSNIMDRPAIQICEAFAHAGYPLDVEAHADRRGRGVRRRKSTTCCAASSPSPSHSTPRPWVSEVGGRERRRSGRAGNPPSAPWAASPTTSAWTAPSRPGSCPMC